MKNAHSIAIDSLLESPSPVKLFSSNLRVSRDIWLGGVDVTIRSYVGLKVPRGVGGVGGVSDVAQNLKKCASITGGFIYVAYWM